MSLREEVEAALDAEPIPNRDRATAALALTYANLIDQAAPAAKYTKALTWLGRLHYDDEDEDAARHVDTIRIALAEHSVASDLGPKLLAALDALLLTARARAAAKKAVTPDDKPASPIDELAAARARLGHPQAVDTAAEGPV
jgi:hypothetical protein